MTPKLFLRVAGPLLILLGALGLTGVLGSISPLAFFHPPYWINWVHFFLGIAVAAASFTPYQKFQGWLVLFPAIVGTAMGVLGLLFGRSAALRYHIPELADPSDHTAHLIVGLFALWAWANRRANVSAR